MWFWRVSSSWCGLLQPRSYYQCTNNNFTWTIGNQTNWSSPAECFYPFAALSIEHSKRTVSGMPWSIELVIHEEATNREQITPTARIVWMKSLMHRSQRDRWVCPTLSIQLGLQQLFEKCWWRRVTLRSKVPSTKWLSWLYTSEYYLYLSFLYWVREPSTLAAPRPKYSLGKTEGTKNPLVPSIKTTFTMASDQIRQMVNFILQEAHEKANEIRVKVCFVLSS